MPAGGPDRFHRIRMRGPGPGQSTRKHGASFPFVPSRHLPVDEEVYLTACDRRLTECASASTMAPIRSTLSPMFTTTTHDDGRIVDSFDDGGKFIRRAPILGAFVGSIVACALATIGGPTLLWLAPAVIVAGTAAGHDLRSGRLPDRLVVTGALLGFVATVAIDGLHGATAFFVGTLALAAPLLVVHLASPCSMAFGDVKYAAALGGLLGIVGDDLGDRLFLAMTALTVASGFAVVGAIAVRSREIPFGPWLFIGTSTALVFTVATGSPVA